MPQVAEEQIPHLSEDTDKWNKLALGISDQDVPAPVTTLASNANLAFITPKVLTWAINRSRYTRQEIAERLNVQPRTIEDWETNPDSHPPIPQGRAISRASARSTRNVLSL